MKCPICDLLETIDIRIKQFKKHHTVLPNQKYNVLGELERIVERHRKKELEKSDGRETEDHNWLK